MAITESGWTAGTYVSWKVAGKFMMVTFQNREDGTWTCLIRLKFQADNRQEVEIARFAGRATRSQAERDVSKYLHRILDEALGELD